MNWQIEAAKMSSIYSRAYLVISATGSVDGDGGIFIQKVPYVTLRGEDQHQKRFQIFVRHGLSHGSFGWDSHIQEPKGLRGTSMAGQYIQTILSLRELGVFRNVS